jgi:predicted membrane protein
VFFAKLWPLILIAFGAKLLIVRNTAPGFVLLLLGVVFLSTNLFSWDFFSVLWPVIIIALGISLLFKSEKKQEDGKVVSEKDFLSETVVFWGIDKKVKSKEFKGGEINVAFGGIKLDLRDAKVAKEGGKLHINCAFGGVEVFVPKECRIKTSGTGILGGWDSQLQERKIDEPVLEITGGVIFGGVDIKE